ncbi:MAG: hypothetical protein WC196_04450 [Bacilli bacterium]|jgi:hypothetical protein
MELIDICKGFAAGVRIQAGMGGLFSNVSTLWAVVCMEHMLKEINRQEGREELLPDDALLVSWFIDFVEQLDDNMPKDLRQSFGIVLRAYAGTNTEIIEKIKVFEDGKKNAFEDYIEELLDD